MISVRRDRPSVTFLDVPFVTELDSESKPFAVLGIPFGVPYTIRAVNSDATNAPTAVRTRSQRFKTPVDHFDFDLQGTLFGQPSARLVDAGDVAADPYRLEETLRRATDAVGELLDHGATPIILGGDDSVPPLAVTAFRGQGPINVVQIDAHLDFRDEVNGIRNGYSSTMRRITEMPWVDKVFQIGMRGTGSSYPQDVADARAAGNRIITADEVHDLGPAWVLDQLPVGETYFITLDIDGLDPSLAPGTSCPLPGGLTWWQVSRIFRGIASRGRFAGITVVEHFPSLDLNGRTSDTIVRLILNLIGTAVRANEAHADPESTGATA
jgi:agmatinase